ncbi:diacylglycerol kinase family protein [Amycolatopsis sp. 195334CR]|uniref:diacylglycerol kinase family protein n=1 Tax=Amycolatopsis sp. 195334CR TaxID=2814588 RepID=UPI001F5D70AD|nr:diacylglycerol kinase family protein [Amycolatopsis sp. 195334CR]
MTVTEDLGVRGVVLVCGPGAPDFPAVDGLRTEVLGARPGKAEVDPLLAGAEHLVVAGTDADLAAIVLRLLRKDRLGDTTIGFVPLGGGSEFAGLWSLPDDPAQAFRLAVRGDVDPVPLIRDDAGGVLLGRGEVGPVQGVGYCDDQVTLRGRARSIVVTPDTEGGAGLVVQVTRGVLFRRPATFYGRAFQLGCIPAIPVSDGVPYPREMKRWTWYRHTEDLRLVRGLA